MKKGTCLVLIMGLYLGLLPVHAVAGAGATFGVTAPYTKVGGNVRLGTANATHLAVSGSDVYAAYGEITPSGDHEVIVGHSADGGSTWDTGTVIAVGPSVNPTAAIAIGPDPVNSGKKIVHVAWGVENDQYGNGTIYYAHNQAGAWSTPAAVSGTLQAGVESRAIAADPLGGVHIVFSSGGGSQINYSRSSDGGSTFFEIGGVVYGYGGSQPSVAADSAGDVFVAWSGNGIYVAKRNYRAYDFGPAVYAGTGQPAGAPVIAVLDANRVWVGYNFGYPLSGSAGIAVAATTNGGTSWTNYNVTTSMWGNVGFAVNSSGVLTIVWDSNGILFSRSTNGGASWSTPVKVDLVGEYPSLALNSLGKALIAYDKGFNQAVYFTQEK